MSSISDIPSGIFLDIVKKLEVVDFIGAGAVCTAWRNLLDRKFYCKKLQIPWLMLSSRDKVECRYFYSITEKKKYDIHLPDIAGRLCVGSSQGFLISVDNNGDLHATNPLTRTHISLPPTSNSPHFSGVVTETETGQITHYITTSPPWIQLWMVEDPLPVSNVRDFHYRKVILSPSRDIAVAIYGPVDKLVFARVGDDKWTALDAPFSNFDDAIFHKGRLHALNYLGTIAIFDDLDSGKPSLVSPEGPLNFEGSPKRYLVESPDGEDLFLVYKATKDMAVEDSPITTGMRVFLLDKATYMWNQMKTLGDIALFLGFNHSMSFCTKEYPGLKRNCIYFTDDNMLFYMDKDEALPSDDMGVFNLEDGTIEPIYVNDDLDRLDWPPPMWFMPTLS